MPDPITSGGEAAVSSLKSAQNVGKQLGAVVMDQQADMEATIRAQHRQRLQAKAKQDYLRSMAEFRAFEKYEKDKAHAKELEQLKMKAIQKYGKNAWAEIEALKVKIEKEQSEEEKLMDQDRQKQAQLFWWCMTASALITYFFKLYKI
jgi:hypothetical protein